MSLKEVRFSASAPFFSNALSTKEDVGVVLTRKTDNHFAQTDSFLEQIGDAYSDVWDALVQPKPLAELNLVEHGKLFLGRF